MVAVWRALVALSQWGLAGLAAINAGRLNTPDTEANPRDYLLYVGAPGIASAAAWVMKWLSKPTKPSAADTTPLTDFLREVLQPPASPVLPNPPLTPVAAADSPKPADWFHSDVSALVAKLLQAGRLDQATRLMDLLREGAHE